MRWTACLLLLVVAACSSHTDSPKFIDNRPKGTGGESQTLCDPTESRKCSGAYGCEGGQICNENGVGFGRCKCGDLSDVLPGGIPPAMIPDGGSRDCNVGDVVRDACFCGFEIKGIAYCDNQGRYGICDCENKAWGCLPASDDAGICECRVGTPTELRASGYTASSCPLLPCCGRINGTCRCYDENEIRGPDSMTIDACENYLDGIGASGEQCPPSP
jgi:hypothetical protein